MLKPFLNNEQNPLTDREVPSIEDEDAIEMEAVADLPEVLQQAINMVPGASKKNSLDKQDLRDLFSSKGAGIEDVAYQISNIMRSGDNDAARLKACQIAMEVQGIISAIDEKTIPSITININGSGNKTLVNLVCPTGT